MKLQCPNGHTEKFYRGDTFATAMAFTPIVDGDGKQVNHDPNQSDTRYTCVTCGVEFWHSRKNGKEWLSWQEREQGEV